MAVVFATAAIMAAPRNGLAVEPENNACVICHDDYWQDMKNSVHSQHQISCDKCHGGDPLAEDMESAKAEGTGFIGIPEKRQIAEVCGNCHADVEAMNFYNIPTDQLARYKTSVHGKSLFEKGDNNVAVCSDCHGYHDVVKVGDPSSPVYPLNLPKTCNQCHGNEKLMDKYGHPSDIFETYKASIHGKALFEKKDLSVANCAKCHGSHGAVPPGVKDVGETCGKCHINERKYFLESPHAAATDKGEFSGCISCHGYHGIEHATVALYDQTCTQCHEPQSKALKEGKAIVDLLRDAEKKFLSAQDIVKQAGIEGIFVEKEAASLEKAKAKVVEMSPVQHTLLKSRIAEFHEDIASITQEITTKVLKKRSLLKWRKIALFPLWIFVFIMIAALWTKYKQLKNKMDGE